jgi:ABC-type transport system involved in multi-copper enzyme maturation permease subunit
MFLGTLALFERSLRIDARAVGPHLARFGLMVVIYAAVILTLRTSDMLGAPGRRFFLNIAYLNLTFMTVLGIEFFATVITEEKEEDTLGLILLAGVNPLGILLGKSGGRMVQALLLIAVQYPFTLLAVTMGGVTPTQVRATYIALFAYLVMLAGVGLFCSTISRRNRSASLWMLAMTVAYWIVPLSCNSILANSTSPSPLYESILQWVASSCVFTQMGSVVLTGFGESVWSQQVITNTLIGGLGVFMSWALFGLAVQEPSSEIATRGLMSRSGRSRWWFPPGRPRGNVIAWKDFHFVAGGKPAVLIRFLFYSSIFLAATLYSHGFFGGILTLGTSKAITATYLNFTLIALSIDAAMLVSRSLYAEIRAQTLVTLVLLPISTGEILYSKIFGSLLNCVPGVICLLVGITVLPHGPACFVDFFNVGPRGLWFFYVTHLILIPHTAAVFAVFVRWGALPLAICTAIGLLVSLFLILVTMQARYDSRFAEVFGFAILCGCVWCHSIVWREVGILAAK